MTERITCEKWIGPRKNYPYVFESPSGSRMQVGTSRDVERSGPAESVPDDLKTDSERLTYLIATSSARIDPWWTWRAYPRMLFPLIRSRAIKRRNVGTLTGFT